MEVDAREEKMEGKVAVKKTGKEYGSHMEIMNKEYDWDHVTPASMVVRSIKNVTREKMAIVIQVMKPGKASGPSEICAEMISASGEVGVKCDGGAFPARVSREREAR